MALGPNEGAAAGLLVDHAIRAHLIDALDGKWALNQVLEAVGEFGDGLTGGCADDLSPEGALGVLAEVAVRNGVVEDSSQGRDRAAMAVMGRLMPRPSEVSRAFWDAYGQQGALAATNWLYELCCDAEYVRRSAIAKNVGWIHDSEWGAIEITINKSKPEKDPRDIAAAGALPVGEAYPACQLCMENEGYSGRPASLAGGHPARQNLRIVPVELGGEKWGLQYSPYAYFDEHCIAMSPEHRPMRIDGACMARLLDFVELFPHYFVGSNADLPIVGGSILSHDHFQGGRHEFPMMRAEASRSFSMTGLPEVAGAVLRWPMTVLRLFSLDRDKLLEAAGRVLGAWRVWTDEEVGILASTNGVRHNTVTPVCRREGDGYTMYLALRCNVTTDEHPLGVFHPHEDKWHVKKENIGLIEVMGLAILPPRLEAEMDSGRLTRSEIGRVFVGVLEDAGVFKWDEPGRSALDRFLSSL